MLYTIPFSTNFLEELAKFILKNYKKRSSDDKELIIFLPTINLISKFRIELLKLYNSKSVKLPKILSLGNLSIEELINIGISFDELKKIKAPINYADEYLLLYKIINEHIKTSNFQQKNEYINHAQLLVNYFADAGIFIEQLVNDHNFLKNHNDLKNIISKYEKELWKINSCPSNEYNHHLINIISQNIDNICINSDIIIAGSSASTESVENLMKKVKKYPNNNIFFSGLDNLISYKKWKKIESGNPQFIFKHLIDKNLITPEDISLLGKPDEYIAANKKEKIKTVAYSNIYEESLSTSLKIKKQIMENNLHSIMVVTNNSELANLLSIKLNELNIRHDNTYKPTPINEYQFFINLWRIIESNGELLHLLSIFRLMLSLDNLNEESTTFIEGLINVLEVQYLNDLGINTLSSVDIDSIEDLKLCNVLERINKFLNIKIHNQDLASNYWKLHIDFLDLLIDLNLLYSSNYQIENFVKILKTKNIFSSYKIKCSSDEYLNILHNTAELDEIFIPRNNKNCKILITDFYNSRLLNADKIFLIGINNNSLPQKNISTNLIKNIFQNFTASPLETENALSRHDFSNLVLNNNNILISYSKEISGVPCSASPWIMENRFKRKNNFSNSFFKFCKLNNISSTSPPVVKPILKSLPSEFNITQLDMLINEPYHFYIRHILLLSKFINIENKRALLYGITLHEILDFINKNKLWKIGSEKIILQEFLNKYNSKIVNTTSNIYICLLRDIKTSLWLDLLHKEKFSGLSVKSEYPISYKYKNLTIKGRIDRLESSQEIFNIIDYKSGTIPSRSDVKNGKSLQLTLQSLIMKIINKIDINTISYWHLSSSAKKHENIILSGKEMELFILESNSNISLLLDYYFVENGAFYPPYYENKNYTHLTRFNEWK